jgi:hypothetical protein
MLLTDCVDAIEGLQRLDPIVRSQTPNPHDVRLPDERKSALRDKGYCKFMPAFRNNKRP